MVIVDWNAPALAALAARAPVAHGPGETEAKAAKGDSSPDLAEERLHGWFGAHFSKLWRFVARIGVSSGSIDDVVQDAFIAASRRHADIHEGREWAFLVGAALRISANYRLRASVRREVSELERVEHEASALPSAEQLLIEKRSRQDLEQVLSALSHEQRSVFVLYELEGFSAPEIAEMTGVPLGTIASRLSRARARFSEAAARLQRARELWQVKP